MEPPEQWTAVDCKMLTLLLGDFPEIHEAMEIDTGGLDRDGVRLLFVVMWPGKTLDDALRAAINARLRARVPNAIYAAPELPRTPDGEKHEAAVRKVFTGVSLENEAVANPEDLPYFVDLFNNL